MKYLLAALNSIVIFWVSVVVLLWFSHYCNAQPVELQEVSITYVDFFKNGRDPLITQNGLKDRGLGKELNLNVNTDFFDYFYWNNTIHSMTDEVLTGSGDQFRLVGWKFVLGFRLNDYIDIGYQHFSKHLLDHTYAHGAFPVQDGIRVDLYLYHPKKRRSLF